MASFDIGEIDKMSGGTDVPAATTSSSNASFNIDDIENMSKEQPKTMAGTPAKWNTPKSSSKFDDTVAAALTSQVSGIGAGILKGWRGISVLATGGSLNDAVASMDEPNLFGAGLKAEAYQPDAGSGAEKINKAMASPYNPINYPADIGGYAGGKLAEAGYPKLATAVDIGAQVGIPIGVAKGLSMAKSQVTKGAYSPK